jgi:ketosteroid isomerase-like protein
MRRLIVSTCLLCFCLLVGPVTAASLLDAQSRLANSMERSGPVQGFLPHVASDVAYLHPGEEIITGEDAVRTFLESIYPSSRSVQTLLHTFAGEESADGRTGYTFGWFEEISAVGGGPPTTAFGRFIATWRKREAGWRVHAFLRLHSAGPPSPPPPNALILDGAPGIPHPGLLQHTNWTSPSRTPDLLT